MSAQLQTALDWFLDRMSESSTWRGIILALTGMGIAIKPDKVAAITAAGLGIVGLINVFRQGSPTKSQVSEALATKVDKPANATDSPKV
jgi:hypothetical protein